MPEIFQFVNLIFSFYSNEHEPIHVHVKASERESIFDLIIKDKTLMEIKIRNNHGKEPLSSREVKMAREFIKNYSSEIVEKWVDFFVLGARVKKTLVKDVDKKKIEIPIKLKEKNK